MNLLHELVGIEEHIEEYLKDESMWESLLVDKHHPVVHRLSLKLKDDRTLILHKIHPSNDSYFHSHSWFFATKILEGGYEMGLGVSSDRDVPPSVSTIVTIRSGDSYQIWNSDVWHYTKATVPSYSIMLMGPRLRERRAQNNSPLSSKQRRDLFDYVKRWYSVEQ